MSALLAVDSYQDVQISRSLACGSFVKRLQVKKRSSEALLPTGPKAAEMTSAVEISLAAIRNTTRLPEDYCPDWV
jgi:hypothetical protein